MRAAIATALAALLLPASAPAATYTVAAQFQDFGPSQLDVLPGETIEWNNVSERTHTITADDGEFDSGDFTPGSKFSFTFANTGTFAYHCTKHAGMTGEIDVRPVILDTLPTAAIPAGNQVEFAGRVLDPSQPVHIERSAGGDFQTIATVHPTADGNWRTSLAAQTSGDYRAAVDTGVSATRRLLVSDRKLVVRATRRGVNVSVTPALPYARIVLQQHLRERFGWWTTKRTRLDYVSEASFAVTRPARVRVVLVDKDGWTPLATSAVLTLGHQKKTKRGPMPMPMPMHR